MTLEFAQKKPQSIERNGESLILLKKKGKDRFKKYRVTEENTVLHKNEGKEGRTSTKDQKIESGCNPLQWEEKKKNGKRKKKKKIKCSTEKLKMDKEGGGAGRTD